MESIKNLFDLIKNNKFTEFKNNLKLLIKNKTPPNINLRDESGNYLLIFAILKNKPDIIKILLDSGAKLDILDQEGRSLLYLPIKYNYLDIIKLFLEYDKNSVGVRLVDIKDRRDNIALHYAIYFKNNPIIKLLLDFRL